MSRKVMCSRYKEELEGLEKPPMPGKLGQEIYEKVSKRAWLEWREDMQIKVLNEYRLNMADPKSHEILKEQMKIFLGLNNQGENLEVENAERGKNQA